MNDCSLQQKHRQSNFLCPACAEGSVLQQTRAMQLKNFF
ncbi:hypothetical protein SynA1544_00903 [Synechococcus sp. A15-44]|nr:hypothetical protein SynA1544_00903 [Synechococcus sp. A15-44]